jgi:hypothetical protein
VTGLRSGAAYRGGSDGSATQQQQQQQQQQMQMQQTYAGQFAAFRYQKPPPRHYGYDPLKGAGRYVRHPRDIKASKSVPRSMTVG